MNNYTERTLKNPPFHAMLRSGVPLTPCFALVLQAFENCQKVPVVIGSPRVIWAVIITSFVYTIFSASFWDGLLVTGSYVWITNTKNVSSTNHYHCVTSVLFARPAKLAIIQMIFFPN